MLRELSIRNFAIVSDLSVTFQPGLNVLTGETGAGKSIIIDAIGLLLGDRASQDMIKTGRKEAAVEAYFDGTHPLLDELGLDNGEGIILRRGLTLQGKGRAYVNDTSVSLQTLSAIGRDLVNIHGQNEHQVLLKKESHLLFVDEAGGLSEEAGALKSLYGELSTLRNRLAEVGVRVRERKQRIEFLKFQIEEIDAAGLKPGEKEAIESERAIMLNLSRLKEGSESAYNTLYGAEGSCIELFSFVTSRIREMEQVDRSAGELSAAVSQITPMLEDVALSLRSFRDKYDIDPQRLTALDERLETIKRLEKKYGVGEEEISRYRDTAIEELRGLEHIEEEIGLLESELRAKEEEVLRAAEELSKKRKAVARKAEISALGELKNLGFQKAEFRIGIRKKESVDANGLDDVELLFSANPGEPPKPLIKVASGGELSRIMLALKCVEIGRRTEDGRQKAETGSQKTEDGRQRSNETLIFDEVDAGIGGVTAQQVGHRLKSISGGYQVFCITHLPQIAALADHHVKVVKTMSGNDVEVEVVALSGEERQTELARMLSGNITDTSLKHAGELLKIDKSHR